MTTRYFCASSCLYVLSAMLSLVLPAEAGQDGMIYRNVFHWQLGSESDVEKTRPAFFNDAARVGPTGKEGDLAYRLLKPDVFQSAWQMPAFDFDPNNFGAINHPFFLTIHYKDVATSPVMVHSWKGGDGFYGAGWVGSLGGAGDGKWKDQTIIIPRSALRSADGKSFRFTMNNIKAAIPVASMTLFSADSDLPKGEQVVAEAIATRQRQVDELNARLLPKFKDLGLPDPGPAPAYSQTEQQRGFRFFLPAINRQLFANSQPRQAELKDVKTLQGCAGQYQSFLVAIRGLKDLGPVSVKAAAFTASAGAADSLPQVQAIRWAAYSPQRAGSSWGSEYRIVPERLFEADSQPVRADQLAILCVTVKVPQTVKAGDYRGGIAITAASGKAELPIELKIHNFKLEHPEHSTHGLFYYIDYGDINPFEIRDMKEHGMDMFVAGMMPQVKRGEDGKFLGTDEVAAAYKQFKSLGYRSPVITMSWDPAKLNDASYRKEFIDAVAQTKEIAERAGFNGTGFFPVDEPHTQELIDKAKLGCDAVHEVPGAKTFITSNPKAVPQLGKSLDYVCYNLSYLTSQRVQEVKQAGQTLMFYCPSIMWITENNRYTAGYYLFKSGAQSVQFFAYMQSAEDIMVDLDGPNRDWNAVFPSMSSPYPDPTLEWESMREGVNDYSYAYTLSAMAERAIKQGKTAEGQKALSVLESLLKEITPEKQSGGPAASIEANVNLKNTQIPAEQLKAMQAQMTDEWYDATREKIIHAIVELKTAMGD